MLDWELSTLGDPLADFSYHLMAWHMPHSDSAAGTASLVGHDLQGLGIPEMADYVDAYVARTGLDPRPALPVYLAYNFFRLAAILQGIVARGCRLIFRARGLGRTRFFQHGQRTLRIGKAGSPR